MGNRRNKGLQRDPGYNNNNNLYNVVRCASMRIPVGVVRRQAGHLITRQFFERIREKKDWTSNNNVLRSKIVCLLLQMLFVDEQING